MTTTDKTDPIRPGEVLMEDFIEGFGITQNKLAVSIGVPPRRINEIVHGKRGITADTAL
ncbi:HigA family addiction module antitoxin [Aeromicrobium sp. PE09-221]|uniref:HigA family addiction module antitoxin n=1 Tax=Aeromicrobium sp. PE09-221 TaxID=1898043 RepID=UPI00191C70A1|nr:HigA family addiction module antitoxin [Aeromicrobium sp. PE09-221]